MTTRQFIANTIGKPSDKDRHCSSVFTSREGIVYSYGYHYPLATIIDGKGYVNTRGYSNTTAKHINWAFSALHSLGYEAHGVELKRGYALDKDSIYQSALDEAQRLIERMADKKRKNTWVFKSLVQQLDNANSTATSIQ